MKNKPLQYDLHIFICSNERPDPSRPSCGKRGKEIKNDIKTKIKNIKTNKKIRVSESSCLGQCPYGPNVMIYPNKIWFSKVSLEDVPTIISELKKLL